MFDSQINLHLERYRNCHAGQGAILFGTGPTLLEYVDFPGPIKAGSNEMVHSDIPLDYYFIGDAGTTERGYLSQPEAYHNYHPHKVRFCRTRPVMSICRYNPMPQNMEGWEYYKITHEHWKKKPGVSKDITRKYYDCGSISFEVLQFLLFTGASPIVLIGHDCSYAHGTFKTKMPGLEWENVIRRNWKKIARSAKKTCPDTAIYIVNPVAMKCFPEITMSEACRLLKE